LAALAESPAVIAVAAPVWSQSAKSFRGFKVSLRSLSKRLPYDVSTMTPVPQGFFHEKMFFANDEVVNIALIGAATPGDYCFFLYLRKKPFLSLKER
jgi:hypothetical protein